MIDLNTGHPKFNLLLEILATIPEEPGAVPRRDLRADFSEVLEGNNKLAPIWAKAKNDGYVVIQRASNTFGRMVSLSSDTAARVKEEWRLYRCIVYWEYLGANLCDARSPAISQGL